MDLVVDGETYEYVNCLCYLGDNIDGDRGADLVNTARIRNGWMNFRELLSILTSRASSLDMKCRVCVRSSMTYGSETKMIRYMFGISWKDRMTCEKLRKLVRVQPIFMWWNWQFCEKI